MISNKAVDGILAQICEMLKTLGCKNPADLTKSGGDGTDYSDYSRKTAADFQSKPDQFFPQICRCTKGHQYKDFPTLDVERASRVENMHDAPATAGADEGVKTKKAPRKRSRKVKTVQTEESSSEPESTEDSSEDASNRKQAKRKAAGGSKQVTRK